MEEDEILQGMWADLFLNYIDTNKNLTLTVYPSILKQLSTHEVAILNFMINNKNKINTSTWSKTKDIGFSNEEIANLNRLGIIAEVPNSHNMAAIMIVTMDNTSSRQNKLSRKSILLHPSVLTLSLHVEDR